jgi:hypothetical protein
MRRLTELIKDHTYIAALSKGMSFGEIALRQDVLRTASILCA